MNVWKVYIEYIDLKNSRVVKKDYFYSNIDLANACYNFYKNKLSYWVEEPLEIELDKNWED